MPRGSQARSGSNPRHLHQPPKPESITTTQPEPEPEQAPPHSRQQAASWTPPATYTIDSQEGQPHTRAKAGALRPRQRTASAADSKSRRHPAGRYVQSGAAPSPSPGNGQHPSQRKKSKALTPYKADRPDSGGAHSQTSAARHRPAESDRRKPEKRNQSEE